MIFISTYLVVESKREVCYKTQEEFLTLFSCSIHNRMMEKKKRGRRQGGKTHYKNGRRGRIRNPSGTGTISSQHLPRTLPFCKHASF
jgi:hypothetical protein